jgi:4-alpha-glucanotransferase
MSQRKAGVLLHPTSLPPGDGLVARARRFLDWAASAGLTVWQVLPLGPAGPAGSPYDASSAFAGDPRWFASPARIEEDELEAFVEANRSWLPDWCLFAALKDRYGGRPWIEWDESVRRRDPEAIDAATRELADELARHRRSQFAFARGWAEIRACAAARGVAILGDVPMYPALDSADVWAHPDLFDLDSDLRPNSIAGVPPDYFSSTGQLWGTPVFRWDRLAETGYAWWIARLEHQLALHDMLRLDHFRGFASYWAVPADAATAQAGAWRPGPGEALFAAARAALGELSFVAEDLGLITADVTALRKSLGFPGMRILQFAFDGDDGEYLPHNFTRDAVVYTGTHDNDTSRGWFASLADGSKRRALDYVGGSGDEIAWSLVRAAMTSVADLAIVPLQDLLDLGSEARMNVPGIAGGNWSWRAAEGALDPELAARVRRLLGVSGRTAG